MSTPKFIIGMRDAFFNGLYEVIESDKNVMVLTADHGAFWLNRIKDDLIELLTKLKNDGKKVVAYGATSKSTTVTNYLGISPELIECIYDTTPIKQNKLSPGAHIPVLPYDQFRKSNPDYVLLFAWNHATEIMRKEKSYMEKDKHWITYIPKVEIH